MNDSDTDNPSNKHHHDLPPSGVRPVYVLPAEDMEVTKIAISDLWQVVWSGKWLIVAVTVICALGGVAYALLATEWYRADVLLAPAESQSSQGLFDSRFGGLGGLVGLAGMGNSDGNSVEAIAVLKSRDFARSFIEDKNLLPVLFSDKWDSLSASWISESPEGIPDIRDGIEHFFDVRRVSQDNETGLVSLQIDWTDAAVAADWADDLVGRLNRHMRDRALREAEANIEFLQAELSSTNIGTLRESIGSLLEAELQKLMLARGNDEFAFRVVDSAQVPKYRIRPKRALTVVLAVLLGGVLSTLFVLVKAVGKNTDARRPKVGSAEML